MKRHLSSVVRLRSYFASLGLTPLPLPWIEDRIEGGVPSNASTFHPQAVLRRRLGSLRHVRLTEPEILRLLQVLEFAKLPKVAPPVVTVRRRLIILLLTPDGGGSGGALVEPWVDPRSVLQPRCEQHQ